MHPRYKSGSIEMEKEYFIYNFKNKETHIYQDEQPLADLRLLPSTIIKWFVPSKSIHSLQLLIVDSVKVIYYLNFAAHHL